MQRRFKMKVTVDIENKTIELSGQMNIKDLVKTLKEVLPNEWKKYSIKPIVEYVPMYQESIKPWWETQPTVVISDNSGEFLYK